MELRKQRKSKCERESEKEKSRIHLIADIKITPYSTPRRSREKKRKIEAKKKGEKRKKRKKEEKEEKERRERRERKDKAQKKLSSAADSNWGLQGCQRMILTASLSGVA